MQLDIFETIQTNLDHISKTTPPSPTSRNVTSYLTMTSQLRLKLHLNQLIQIQKASCLGPTNPSTYIYTHIKNKDAVQYPNSNLQFPHWWVLTKVLRIHFSSFPKPRQASGLIYIAIKATVTNNTVNCWARKLIVNKRKQQKREIIISSRHFSLLESLTLRKANSPFVDFTLLTILLKTV